MLGRSSGNHDWLLANASACVFAVFVYATQAIAFEWKPGFTVQKLLLLAEYWRLDKLFLVAAYTTGTI